LIGHYLLPSRAVLPPRKDRETGFEPTRACGRSNNHPVAVSHVKPDSARHV
jgi:hypothetical protein